MSWTEENGFTIKVFEIDEQEAGLFDEGFERLEKKYRPSQEEFYIHSHSIIQ